MDSSKTSLGTEQDSCEPLDAGSEPVSELNKSLQAENERLKDQLLRTLADMDNLQKRVVREKEEMQKFAITSFARDLLTVADTLGHAMSSVSEGERESSPLLKSIYEGVSLTYNELMKIFHKFQIKIINPVGEKFDHNFHQAVAEIEDAQKEAGDVVEVLQRGYILEGRLLRPAMVTVSK